ncbi:MAG: PAS domain-containing sensor histidine kinase, partial [Chitinophagaceae bacterium]
VEELRVSEERYRAALQSASMSAWDWDIQQDSVVWNDQHYLLLGLTPDGLPKNAAFFSSFVHSEDLEMVHEQLRTAVAETGIYRAQFRAIRRDNNKVCWFSGYGRVVEKRNGQATRMVGVMHDITESKLLEQQKDEFIGIASHELKTPVTSIKIYGEILQERFEEADDAANAQMMKAMNAQVDRLIELIANLFDTTRIAEGKLLLHYEELDLNQLISEKAEEVQRISPKHNIILNLGEVPLVSADRERISQVLTNLLSNAVKYSPSGGEVLVTSKKTENAVMVSVKDSGIGIAEESQTKIFERFFRVNVPSLQTYPGMGLGLYISSGIISRHGGAITVTSEEGKGSIFTFTLPVPE